jgi:diguanylate cyclase (GGDEF)-like protein
VRILIADDDPLSRRLLEATLVRSGHDVTVVGDGADAARMLLDPAGPRLAILDWMMPGADGLQVCRRVRQRPVPYVYLILLTSRDRREDMMEGLASGADDFLKKPFDNVELTARLRSGERVLDLQERLLKTQEALRHEASHDQLTGLWNRRMILSHLERMLGHSGRARQPIGVLLVDVDHFKQINDTFGHPAGDEVLRQVGANLQSVMRLYDAVGRYGGEEFLIVLFGCDHAQASSIAERARERMISSPVTIGTMKIDVTISVGMAWSAAGEESAEVLIQTADEGLYEAKGAGRNRVSETARMAII